MFGQCPNGHLSPVPWIGTVQMPTREPYEAGDMEHA